MMYGPTCNQRYFLTHISRDGSGWSEVVSVKVVEVLVLTEVAIGHAAMVIIWLGVVSIGGCVSSAIVSV